MGTNPIYRYEGDTASRGPTTIVTPKSQFRTDPSDHGLLRQSALEELTNLPRTESPRQNDRNKSDHGKRWRHGGGRERRGGEGFSHTVEAGVHLWSLGVLTAAGCGIGSVHAVVRSNLLVEPSEAQRIEEGTKCSIRDVKAAAKQLTIYEIWMSTAELNSNGENDKKPAKEKDASSAIEDQVEMLVTVKLSQRISQIAQCTSRGKKKRKMKQ
ncbi:hypothetical protein F511_20196 [Dorcoceras hygrometricum]|uniref:Uncharacterized protein n=1 Tax=Dorcoceras hygrometricum TaxID=472368 RepID=A0A2Z7A7S3_9LAMI|nr:hypothetical protein F511_20196 [Dorcoceras hygrometricum]